MASGQRRPRRQRRGQSAFQHRIPVGGAVLPLHYGVPEPGRAFFWSGLKVYRTCFLRGKTAADQRHRS